MPSLAMGFGLHKQRFFGGGGSFTGFLNSFSGASIGFSFRQLDSNYTGNCIRVRRSSDNAELNIGFVNNVLDASALLTFAGSGSAFVTIWYDQSGNANNATQTVSSMQPTIVNSGSLILENGKPAIDFPQGLEGNFNFSLITQLTAITVAKLTSKNNVNYILFNNDDTKGIFYGGSLNGINGLGIFDGDIKSIAGYSLDQKLGWFNYNGTNYEIAENGDAITSVNNGSSFSLNSIGRPAISSVEFIGKIQEIILYSTEQSANKVSMENNINDFYSIY